MFFSTRHEPFPLTTKYVRRITFLYLSARRITFWHKVSTVFLKQGSTFLSFPRTISWGHTSSTLAWEVFLTVRFNKSLGIQSSRDGPHGVCRVIPRDWSSRHLPIIDRYLLTTQQCPDWGHHQMSRVQFGCRNRGIWGPAEGAEGRRHAYHDEALPGRHVPWHWWQCRTSWVVWEELLIRPEVLVAHTSRRSTNSATWIMRYCLISGNKETLCS